MDGEAALDGLDFAAAERVLGLLGLLFAGLAAFGFFVAMGGYPHCLVEATENTGCYRLGDSIRCFGLILPSDCLLSCGDKLGPEKGEFRRRLDGS